MSSGSAIQGKGQRSVAPLIEFRGVGKRFGEVVAAPNLNLKVSAVFASIRRGITPEINAIGTVVLTVSLTLLLIAQLILRRSDNGGRSPSSSGTRD